MFVVHGVHPYQSIDRSSVANVNEIRTTNISLEVTVNFAERRLYGNITHTFLALASGVNKVQLDIENIKIVGVFDVSNNVPLKYTAYQWPWITDESNDALDITLSKALNFHDQIKVRIEYYTEPDGLGMNWLNENQTSTHQPFFYTDCQTYYCRSLAPLQDTPSVKSPFSAKIRTQKPLMALSSGHPIGERDIGGNMTEYEFIQVNPVPSYLLAVLAGVLERRAVDRRTFIYAEPYLIEKSVEVLSDIGTFLNIVYFLYKFFIKLM